MTYSGSTALPASRGRNRIGGQAVWGLALGYVLLYAYGYLSKPVPSPAAIWPADALSFAAFLLLPLRSWPLIMLFMVCSELLSIPLLNWISGEPAASLGGDLRVSGSRTCSRRPARPAWCASGGCSARKRARSW